LPSQYQVVLRTPLSLVHTIVTLALGVGYWRIAYLIRATETNKE